MTQILGARPVCRIEREYNDRHAYSVQGNRYFEVGGKGYWAVSRYNRKDNMTFNIDIYDVSPNDSDSKTKPVSSIYGYFMHCNEIKYDERSKQLIVSGIRYTGEVTDADTGKKVDMPGSKIANMPEKKPVKSHLYAYFFDVSNPLKPNLVRLLDVYRTAGMSVGRYDDKTLWHAASGTTTYSDTYKSASGPVPISRNYVIYLTDLDGGNRRKLCDFDVSFDGFSTDGMTQSVEWAEEKKRFLFLHSNRWMEYDVDGNLVETNTFARHYCYVGTEEVENIAYYKGKYWFGNAVGTAATAHHGSYVTGTQMVTTDRKLPDGWFDTGVEDSVTVNTLFCYDPKDESAGYSPMGQFGTTIEVKLDPLKTNPITNPLFNRSFVFKYPKDMQYCIEEYAGRHIEVQLQSDCKFVIPVTANIRLNMNNKACVGVFVSAPCVIYNARLSPVSSQYAPVFRKMSNAGTDRTFLIYCYSPGGQVYLSSDGYRPDARSFLAYGYMTNFMVGTDAVAELVSARCGAVSKWSNIRYLGA